VSNSGLQKEVGRIPTLRILPVGGFLINNLGTIHKRFPDIVHLKVGVADFYLPTNPDLVQEILVTKQRDFIKGRYLQRTKKVFGEGLLTSEGDFHHRQRRLVQPAFHQDRIASYARIMTSYAEREMSSWKDGQVLDIHTEMMRFTMSIVAKCLFGTDIRTESSQITKDLTTTIEYFNRLSSPLSNILQKLPTNKKYESAVKRIDSMVRGLIEKRRSSNENQSDLMSMLLRAKDQDGTTMTDQQIRDEVLILFTAGHETTANALTWTWYLLSENPSVEKRLHDEVDSVIPKDQVPRTEDANSLQYTRQVFTESMRLYPPAWIVPREAIRDCEIGRYLIPKGGQVVVSQFVNHHDPRFFPDPERFDPDRWAPEDEKNLPKFAYFPFGGGSRSCVGEPFAWMEGILLLATIGRKWSMRHLKNHKVEMHPRITLRPRYGMKMMLHQRSSMN
jgi:cytochrome P450